MRLNKAEDAVQLCRVEQNRIRAFRGVREHYNNTSSQRSISAVGGRLLLKNAGSRAKHVIFLFAVGTSFFCIGYYEWTTRQHISDRNEDTRASFEEAKYNCFHGHDYVAMIMICQFRLQIRPQFQSKRAAEPARMATTPRTLDALTSDSMTNPMSPINEVITALHNFKIILFSSWNNQQPLKFKQSRDLRTTRMENPSTALPRVTIQFCTQCKWMLRAAYVSSSTET